MLQLYLPQKAEVYGNIQTVRQLLLVKRQITQVLADRDTGENLGWRFGNADP